MNPTIPDITAIIVSWNVRQQLRRCLSSLMASQNIKLTIVVVDNGSADGCADMVRTEFHQAVLISNPENRGFAAAVNQGLALANGEAVLINPDLTLNPDTIHCLHETLVRHPTVGIVGGQLKYPDGRIQPSVKRFPQWSDLMLTLSMVPNLVPSIVRTYHGLDIEYDREQLVDQVMGSCFMIRSEARRDVGPFDEGFFLWYEEVDYCRRAREKGWQTLYTPTAQATHERGASFRQQSKLQKQVFLTRSVLHYSRKYFGALPTLGLVPIAFLGFLFAAVITIFNIPKPRRAKNL